MTEKSYIDEVMGFDPSEAVTVFESATAEKKVNTNIYKTNPINTVNEDGNYHSKIRILLNPYDIKRSIVHRVAYSMRDEKGFFQVVSSLSIGDKSCPIFTGWKKLWFAKDNTEEKKAWAKKMFDKSETDWVLVQIIEDENQPELVGTIKVMKLPKIVLNRLIAKMNPTDPKKQKQPIMDYLFGPILEMNVVPGPDDASHPERKQREISYDLCDFDTDETPIIKTDGTPLFTDEELEAIDEYNTANNDLVKAKTDAKRIDAEKRKTALVATIRPLYGKAIEYLKVNALNLVEECSYTQWTDETKVRVDKWLEKVLKMEDPTNMVSDSAQVVDSSQAEAKNQEEDGVVQLTDDFGDLPF